jgi:hypothetical protein
MEDMNGTEIPKTNKNICVGNVSGVGVGKIEDVVSG